MRHSARRDAMKSRADAISKRLHDSPEVNDPLRGMLTSDGEAMKALLQDEELEAII